jgi:hypothetical protein
MAVTTTVMTVTDKQGPELVFTVIVTITTTTIVVITPPLPPLPAAAAAAAAGPVSVTHLLSAPAESLRHLERQEQLAGDGVPHLNPARRTCSVTPPPEQAGRGQPDPAPPRP